MIRVSREEFIEIRKQNGLVYNRKDYKFYCENPGEYKISWSRYLVNDLIRDLDEAEDIIRMDMIKDVIDLI